jgi:hypothetical protein
VTHVYEMDPTCTGLPPIANMNVCTKYIQKNVYLYQKNLGDIIDLYELIVIFLYMKNNVAEGM